MKTPICSAPSAPESPAPRCRRSPGLSDTQIWQLVSYVRSLQGRPSSGGAASTTGDVGRRGDAAAGELLFLGRAGCATCHEVNGRGGIVGPDLSGAGQALAAALRQKIVDPNNPLPTTPAAWRARRRPRWSCAGRRHREDAGRPRDSRHPPQRRHVHLADDRRVGPVAAARQTDARVGPGRFQIADARRLCDAALRGGDRESRRVSSTSAGPRLDQDRRAADRRRA